MILSALKGQSLDESMKHLASVRAIEHHKMLGDRYRKFTKWVHDRAEGESLPENFAAIPLRFISAEADKSLWHVVPIDFNSDAPNPVCQWKKRESFFKSNVCFADSVQEALCMKGPSAAIARNSCQQEHSVFWKSQLSPGARPADCPVARGKQVRVLRSGP